MLVAASGDCRGRSTVSPRKIGSSEYMETGLEGLGGLSRFYLSVSTGICLCYGKRGASCRNPGEDGRGPGSDTKWQIYGKTNQKKGGIYSNCLFPLASMAIIGHSQ